MIARRASIVLPKEKWRDEFVVSQFSFFHQLLFNFRIFRREVEQLSELSVQCFLSRKWLNRIQDLGELIEEFFRLNPFGFALAGTVSPGGRVCLRFFSSRWFSFSRHNLLAGKRPPG